MRVACLNGTVACALRTSQKCITVGVRPVQSLGIVGYTVGIMNETFERNRNPKKKREDK